MGVVSCTEQAEGGVATAAHISADVDASDVGIEVDATNVEVDAETVFAGDVPKELTPLKLVGAGQLGPYGCELRTLASEGTDWCDELHQGTVGRDGVRQWE